jgi:F plasmid transfer operon, TraF, protein
MEVSPILQLEPQWNLRVRDRRRDSAARRYAKLARMPRLTWRTGVQLTFCSALLLCLYRPGAAQTFESVGTRASGMGGAFVAVADDASAVYWNPAGLILGASFFSLAIDNNRGEAEPDEDAQRGGSRSATLIAFSTPPLGLSYYRLGSTKLTPLATTFTSDRATRLERLTTHHAGVTLVQSVTSSFAVATTLKLVRGIAASGVVIDGNRDDLLDDGGDLPDRSTSEFDADIGVMATLGSVRAGLTVRNATEPDFETPGDEPLELKRQTRAGLAYFGMQGIILAADIDLERAQGSLGEVRNFAAGAEVRLMRRAQARTGVRFNTLSDQPGGRAAVFTLGGSVVPFRSLLVDAQVTMGADAGDRGWGIAARLVY